MAKSQYLTAFNNHFEEFVEDIKRVFPEDTDISAAAVAIKQMRKANPTIVLKGFREYVTLPYSQQIDDGDIEFFLKKDYRSDLGNLSSSVILEKIDMLRKPISDMDIEDQKKVVKYLQNLKKLTELYI